jgi:transcriptional regulator with XRE-family HTH domain
MKDEASTTPLGAYIRKARERAGMGVRELAHKADIDHGYLAHLEAGRRVKPSADVLHRLADVLGIDDQELLKFIGVTPRLPEPRIYFRRKLGVNAREADVLARLIEDHQAKQAKEIKPGQRPERGRHHETSNH